MPFDAAMQGTRTSPGTKS